jgi:hypothetical protein
MNMQSSKTGHQDVASQSIPASLVEIFKDRPILIGESAESYDALLVDIMTDIGPSGAIEYIWCKEVADYVWDLMRLRRMRRQLIEDGFTDALIELADYDFIRKADQDDDEISEMIEYCVQGARDNNPPDVEILEHILSNSRLTYELVIAEVHRTSARKLEMLDREIVRYERRRDELLHQSIGWAALRRARAREAFERAAKTIDEQSLDVDASTRGDAAQVVVWHEQVGDTEQATERQSAGEPVEADNQVRGGSLDDLVHSSVGKTRKQGPRRVKTIEREDAS